MTPSLATLEHVFDSSCRELKRLKKDGGDFLWRKSLDDAAIGDEALPSTAGA
jgi:hypothetical protein